MGAVISKLLCLFRVHAPDAESNKFVLKLANAPEHWSAGHAVFDEVRRRLLVALENHDRPRELQYHFEESCSQALYNATDPPDPFDCTSAFFVAGHALSLARVVGVPVEDVIGVLSPNA
jgi:hypothetical protein